MIVCCWLKSAPFFNTLSKLLSVYINIALFINSYSSSSSPFKSQSISLQFFIWWVEKGWQIPLAKRWPLSVTGTQVVYDTSKEAKSEGFFLNLVSPLLYGTRRVTLTHHKSQKLKKNDVTERYYRSLQWRERIISRTLWIYSCTLSA